MYKIRQRISFVIFYSASRPVQLMQLLRLLYKVYFVSIPRCGMWSSSEFQDLLPCFLTLKLAPPTTRTTTRMVLHIYPFSLKRKCLFHLTGRRGVKQKNPNCSFKLSQKIVGTGSPKVSLNYN